MTIRDKKAKRNNYVVREQFLVLFPCDAVFKQLFQFTVQPFIESNFYFKEKKR